MKEIILSQGKVAIIDDEDFELVNQYSWYAKAHGLTFYAVHKGWKKPVIYMHNLIMGGKGIDHDDSDGLNNRRSNLGFLSQRHNVQKAAKTKSTYGRCIQKHSETDFQVIVHKNGERFSSHFRSIDLATTWRTMMEAKLGLTNIVSY